MCALSFATDLCVCVWVCAAGKSFLSAATTSWHDIQRAVSHFTMIKSVPLDLRPFCHRTHTLCEGSGVCCGIPPNLDGKWDPAIYQWIIVVDFWKRSEKKACCFVDYLWISTRLERRKHKYCCCSTYWILSLTADDSAAHVVSSAAA